MINIKKLDKDPNKIIKNLKKRNFSIDFSQLISLRNKLQKSKNENQYLQRKHNEISKKNSFSCKKEDNQSLFKEAYLLSQKIKKNNKNISFLQIQLNKYISTIPNLLDSDVPEGKNESDNIIIYCWGNPKKFDFIPMNHIQLSHSIKGIDLKTSSKLSGSRFSIMKGEIAELYRAIIQFMMDVHIYDNGYVEVYIPYLVKKHCLFGTGQLPKFHKDYFYIQGDSNLVLIPTSEVSLINIASNTIYSDKDLPIKMVAFSPCFRKEAGSYGKSTYGIMRQHQFDKVELVQLVKSENSDFALHSLTKNAEKILQKLELPYRLTKLCSGNTGFSASKTYDLEVWIPSQNKYKEISSCSNCRDFQSRRIKARWKNKKTGKIELLHTLNGSGLAVGRTLIAIMENYQNIDGNILIPKVLQSYMKGKTIIQLSNSRS